MARIHSDFEGGAEVCKALGLDPKNVRSIVIRWQPGDVAMARITRYVWAEDKVAVVLERYRLCLKDSDND